jgi:NitT/TauT family transport system substrate-binding protein
MNNRPRRARAEAVPTGRCEDHIDLTPFMPREHFLKLTGAAIGAAAAGLSVRPARGAAAAGHIHMGYQPSTHQVAWIVAQEKGWWLQNLKPLGVTDVTGNLFPSGPPEMSAMLGGDLAFAYVGWAPPISAIARGLDAKVVCSVQSVGSVLTIRPDIPYDGPNTHRSDPAALAGLKFGVLPPGSTDHTEFDYFLTLHALRGKVTLIPMGIADAVTALQSGAIDGHWVPEPAGAFSEFNGHGKVVLSSTESGPFLKNHACCCMLASGAMQRDHPDVVEKAIETHITTTRWMWAHPDEAIDIASSHLKVPNRIYKHSVLSNRSPWNYDPYPRVETALYFAKVQHDLGLIPKEPSQSDLFNFSFYDNVAKRMHITDAIALKEEREATARFKTMYAALRADETKQGVKFADVRSDI